MPHAWCWTDGKFYMWSRKSQSHVVLTFTLPNGVTACKRDCLSAGYSLKLLCAVGSKIEYYGMA